MVCGTYKRVSTQAQADNYSIDKQRDDGKLFCKNMGWKEVSYEDIKSGNDVTRNGWQQMLTDVQAGKIQAIWVGAVDRFSRNTQDGLAAVEILRQNKTKFFISGIEYDIYNETTYLLITMQFAIGQLERANIKNRLTSGKRRSYNEGNRRINSVFGYEGKYDDKGKRIIEVNEEEAEVIRKIFKLFIEDGESLSFISRWFNSSGYKAKRAGKTLNYKGSIKIMRSNWVASQVKAILKRPEYTGLVWNYDKTELLESNYFSQIIDRETWEKAQDRLKKIAIPQNSGYRIVEHPVSGVMRCAMCGAPYFYVVFKRKNKRYYYYRHKIENQAHKDCDGSSKCIDATFVENVFAVLYINTFSDRDELMKIKEVYADGIKKDEDELEADRKRINERIMDADGRMKKLYALAEITDDISQVAGRINELKEEIEEWKAKLIDVEKLWKEKVNKYSEILDQFTENNLAEFLNSKEYERRILYLRAIKSALVSNGLLSIEFITGRKVDVRLKEKQPWLMAQIANYEVGVYTIDWINKRRNGVAEFIKEKK